MRLNEAEYKDLIGEIERAEEMDNLLLTKLNTFHMECDARCLEAAMGKRSSRSTQAHKLPKIVHELEKRFNCRLIYRNGKPGTIDGYYELHDASYNPWT